MSKIINLSDYRGLVSISGEDKEKFLQGIISNDAKKISETSLIYALLLTPQGKYIFDFLIFEHNQKYYIDCEKPRVEELIKKLSQYKLRSKVIIEDASAEFLIAQNLNNIATNDCISFADPRSQNLGTRLYIAYYITPEQKNNFIFEETETGLNIYKKARFLALAPEGSFNNGGDFKIDETYPMQFNMIENNGVDFKKGCYVGQEVTARMHYRGNVKKGIFLAEISGDNNVEVGVEISVNGAKIGTLVNKIDNLALIHAEIEALANLVDGNNSIKITNNNGNTCFKVISSLKTPPISNN
jgi:folate-binding protein YgfZ